MKGLQLYCQTLQKLFFGCDDDEAVWIEIDAKGAKNAVAIYAQPLNLWNFWLISFSRAKIVWC